MSPARRSMSSRMHLTVMTYNIHGAKGVDGRRSLGRICEVVRQSGADLIALQEVDVNRDRSGCVDQACSLADALEMEFLFHPAMKHHDGLYGVALLSRHPFRLVKAGLLPHVEPFETRAAMWALVDSPAGPIHLLNTHLGLRRSERHLQLERLAGPEWLDHDDFQGPAIVCGDFNSVTRSRLFRHALHRFKERRRLRLVPSWGGSFMGVLPIDHILVTPHFRVIRAQKWRSWTARVASDHLPVVATLEYQQEA